MWHMRDLTLWAAEGRCQGLVFGALSLLRDRCLVPIKLQAIPPLLEHLFLLAQLMYHFSAPLS